MKPLRETLEQVDLFANLPSDKLDELAGRGINRNLGSGEVLVNQGVDWPHLFLVLEGQLHAAKESPEGRSLVAGTFRAGEVFWGLAFFIPNSPSPMLIQAAEESTIHIWRSDYLVPMIKAQGEMSWELCLILIQRMLRASGIVEDLAFQPVMGRLAGLLLDQFSDVEGEAVARFLTLDDMAARIGSTREMVCRYLQKFSEQGAIELSRTEIKIVDRSKLGA